MKLILTQEVAGGRAPRPGGAENAREVALLPYTSTAR